MSGIFREEEWEREQARQTPEETAAGDAAAFARVRLGIALDAKQEEVLRRMGRRGILNCSRQWGKSTMAAAKSIHRAYTEAGVTVLVASPSERQSGEFVRKAGEMLRKLGIRPVGDGFNETSLRLPNGSRVVGLPGSDKTTRGFSSVSLLVIDEAARVEDSMYRALRPMLAVGDGDLWMMSTPCGKRGFFYDAWAHGGEEWMRVSVPATECPRISKPFLEEERRNMGRVFEQEYMCSFVDFGAGAFDREVVESALDEDEEAWELEPMWR